jgi:hypothetical protein
VLFYDLKRDKYVNRAWNMNVPQASVEQSEEEIFGGIVFTFWQCPHMYDFAVKLKSRSFKRKLNRPLCDNLYAALRLEYSNGRKTNVKYRAKGISDLLCSRVRKKTKDQPNICTAPPSVNMCRV